MIKGPVLIPLDGSQLAEQAIPLGISVAKHTNVDVILLRVLPSPSRVRLFARHVDLTTDSYADTVKTEAETYLRSVADRIEAVDGAVTIYTADGDSATAIVEAARAHDAGMIVMGTHGRSGLRRWALGSVTNAVLQFAQRPLLLCRPRTVRAVDLTTLPAFDRIVVPLDGSKVAETVLPHAEALARAYGARVILFRVLRHPPPHLPEPQASAARSAYELTVGREARAYLADLTIELAARGLDVEFNVGVEPVAEAILRIAGDTTADLIAMTCHTRDGMSRTILGSVTDRVVRAGQVPVLVTRP